MKKELYNKVAEMPTIKVTTKNKDGESTTSYVKRLKDFVDKLED